jgi:hypothetical protein
MVRVWPLARHLIRACGGAVLVVLVLALAAGAIRLLPWIVSPAVPLAVTAPFAEALGALACETALMIGLPAGCGLGAAKFVERGEARALMALGSSPAGLVLRAAPPVLVLALLGSAVGVGYGADASKPGRIARELVARGRQSCDEATAPAAFQVPLVGVTWLCFPGERRRAVGPLPGFGERAWFTAESLVPSEDLRRFELSDLRVVVRGDDGRERVHLSVQTAVVSGFAPWGRPARLPAVWRAVLAAATPVLLALFSAWLVISTRLGSRPLGLLVAAGPTLVAWALWHAADRIEAAGYYYLLVPLCGVALVCALRLPVEWLARLSHGRRTRRAECGHGPPP